MDLIEQLGGYEKAKRELKLKEEHSMFQCCTAITADMIRDALLEYRRANGIYEVGDKVVSAISRDSNNQVFEITAVNPDFMESGEFQLSYGFFKHATDEEIKAGCRL